jgi:hypothetical protein
LAQAARTAWGSLFFKITYYYGSQAASIVNRASVADEEEKKAEPRSDRRGHCAQHCISQANKLA